MSFWQAVALGAVQGVTEFLPVSSSGHLVLLRGILGVGEVPLLFDVLLHLSTLAATVVVFRARLCRLLVVGVDLLRPPERCRRPPPAAAARALHRGHGRHRHGARIGRAAARAERRMATELAGGAADRRGSGAGGDSRHLPFRRHHSRRRAGRGGSRNGRRLLLARPRRLPAEGWRWRLWGGTWVAGALYSGTMSKATEPTLHDVLRELRALRADHGARLA